MIEKFELTIPCLSDEVRNITVYVPDHQDYRKRYPVLYMFDGQNIFFDEDATYGKSWGMYDYLTNNNVELIVVGIDSSRKPDNTRLCEYSPYNFDDFQFGRIRGLGKKHLKWLVDEFKPLIDSKYPTLADRNHTYIGGSSMGGLMAYYACLAYNDIFSRAACLSPSFWVDNQKLVNFAKKSKLDPDTTIYLDYGSKETGGRFGKRANVCFWEIVDVLRNKNINLNVRVIQFGEHCEASWEKQIPEFLPLLMKGVQR